MMNGPQQTIDNFTTPAMNQQSNNLLGQPPIQAAGMPSLDMGALNTTALQSTPEVANMIKALKGGAQ